jgi:DNA-binding HxlR family transcriptional regulator
VRPESAESSPPERQPRPRARRIEAQTQTEPEPAKDASAPTVAEMVESVVGCKWSLHVLAQIRAGNVRPGTLERSASGLTHKVLSERLSKFLRFGIVKRHEIASRPAHVEYRLTPFGERFARVIDEIDRLQHSLSEQEAGHGSGGP